MNENAKTICLITIAAALALIVWISRPGDWSGSPNKSVGEKLTADFDPLAAVSLDITEYDESTATVRPFQVAMVDVKGKTALVYPVAQRLSGRCRKTSRQCGHGADGT